MDVRWSLLSGCLLSACATAAPATPAALSQRARTQPKRALVQYLAQPGATATVCSPGGAATINARTLHAVADATRRGKLEAQPAGECLRRGLDALDARQTAKLLPKLLESYIAATRTTQPRNAAAAMEHALANTTAPARHPQPYLRLRDDLARALDAGHIPTPHGAKTAMLRDTLEVTAGVWKGQAVDEALIRSAEADVLDLFAQHLPSDPLRRAALHEVVRRTVQTSTHPDVVRNRADIVQRLLKTGANRVDLAQHRLEGGHFDPERGPRAALVRQDIPQQSARLLFPSPTGEQPESRHPLRGWIWVRVAGYEEALTVCDEQATLDPTPCISPDALSLAGPWATLDPVGDVRLRSDASLRDVVGLLDGTAALPLEVRFGEQVVVGDALPLQFIAPDPVLFTTERPGTPGPSIQARVSTRPNAHLVFEIESRDHRQLAVVHTPSPGAFALVSRGGPGLEGRSGRDGSSTWLAEHGEDGEDGGKGGDIEVSVACDPEAFERIEGWLKRRVLSVGGARGRGGDGGDGAPLWDANACSTSTPKDSDVHCAPRWASETSDPGRQGRDGYRGDRGTVTIHRDPAQ